MARQLGQVGRHPPAGGSCCRFVGQATSVTDLQSPARITPDLRLQLSARPLRYTLGAGTYRNPTAASRLGLTAPAGTPPQRPRTMSNMPENLSAPVPSPHPAPGGQSAAQPPVPLPTPSTSRALLGPNTAQGDRNRGDSDRHGHDRSSGVVGGGHRRHVGSGVGEGEARHAAYRVEHWRRRPRGLRAAPGVATPARDRDRPTSYHVSEMSSVKNNRANGILAYELSYGVT